jgi:anti-sigma factor RsiW
MSDYLDKQLASAAQQRMEHHLAECDGCRRLLKGLRRTVDGLNRLATPSTDPVQIAAAVRPRLNDRD